jgi:hypothetical protein
MAQLTNIQHIDAPMNKMDINGTAKWMLGNDVHLSSGSDNELDKNVKECLRKPEKRNGEYRCSVHCHRQSKLRWDRMRGIFIYCTFILRIEYVEILRRYIIRSEIN